MRSGSPLTIAFLLATLVAASASSAGAQEEPSFVAQPGPKARTDPGGAFFLLELETGSRLTQQVGLRNDGADRLTLDLAAVDGETAETGGVSYNLPGDELEGAGGWISLERDSVTLKPGGSETIPFTVQVPAGAVSGIHLAGVSVTPADSGGPEPTGQAQIVVTTRRVVPVLFDLPGPQEPELVVNGVEPNARPDGLYLEIEIENVGTDATEGQGIVTLEDAGFEQEFPIGRFVPHTSIRYPLRWRTSAQAGEYCGAVTIDYEQKNAEWEGCFTVSQEVQEQLADRGATDAPPSSSSDRWPLIAAGVALLLGVAATVFFRMRRGRRGKAAQDGPEEVKPGEDPAPAGAQDTAER